MEGGDVQRQGRDREDASVVSRAVPASALPHRRRWLGRMERGGQAQAQILYRGARWRIDLLCRSVVPDAERCGRSEEHTSELQSLMRRSYAVFCLTKK